MEKKKFISWRRVSTGRQMRSGLGMESQLAIVTAMAEEEGGEIVADYAEGYTGTDLAGCKELQKAIAHCKRIGATLIIAKTDRFRNDGEAITIYNEMSKNIYFCDCPTQDEFVIKLMFLLAAREAKIISIRTKQALQAKKARGEKLGSPKGCDMSKAYMASARSKQAAARENENNKRFWLEIREWMRDNGRITRDTDVASIVDMLNRKQLKTARGMEFDVPRFRSMYQKCIMLYAS